jgi:hypothetical protein
MRQVAYRSGTVVRLRIEAAQYERDRGGPTYFDLASPS